MVLTTSRLVLPIRLYYGEDMCSKHADCEVDGLEDLVWPMEVQYSMTYFQGSQWAALSTKMCINHQENI